MKSQGFDIQQYVIENVIAMENRKFKGEESVKDKLVNKKKELINQAKKSVVYKDVLNRFSDAELIDIFLNKGENSNDWFY